MTPAELAIRRRIQLGGPITFAEFIELALYGRGGYYASRSPVGRAGDYYTSPAVHPLFGALLAVQLEQMWRLLGTPSRFHVIEPGAGDGRLAADVTGYAQHLGAAFATSLAYIAVDRAPRPTPASWPCGQWLRASGLPVRGLTGCILSNELVDSLPVHQVARDQGRLQEVYVTLRDGRLAEELGEPSDPALAETLAAQGVTLREGWRAEVGLAAAQWTAEAARALRRGYVITVDYGDPAERLYTEARRRGTVMSYYRHTRQPDPYTRVGLQDITAHANFTTLVDAGAQHGLRPVVLMTQAEFLRHLGAQRFVQGLRRVGLPQREHDANSMAMLDLLKPSGLGGFRVLVQAKEAPAAELVCLRRPPTGTVPEPLPPGLPVPLLSPGHLDLMAARYSHLAP